MDRFARGIASEVNWLHENLTFVVICVCAVIGFAYTLFVEMEAKRKMWVRLVTVGAIVIFIGVPPIATWVDNRRTEELEERLRGTALEVARRSHVKLLSESDEKQLAAAMRQYSDMPMFIQSFPTTTFSFGDPFDDAMKTTMKNVTYIPNFQFSGTFFDDPGAPPAPKGIDIYYTTNASRSAGETLEDSLSQLGFSVGLSDLNSNRQQNPEKNDMLVVRIYNP